MSATPIRFSCTHCHASIKAAAQLSGRAGGCPRCGNHIVVPRRIPEDAGSVLVLMEAENRFTLAVPRPLRYSRTSMAMPYRLRQSA